MSYELRVMSYELQKSALSRNSSFLLNSQLSTLNSQLNSYELPKKWLFIAFLTLNSQLSTLNLAWGQFELQVGGSPGGHYHLDHSTFPSRPPIDPFAAALTEKLLAAKTSGYWSAVSISTGNPSKDLTRYMRHGLGRAEIITLLLIAERGKQKFKEIAKKRVKGARLRELASQYNIPYKEIRSEALRLKASVLESLRSTHTSTASAVSPQEDLDVLKKQLENTVEVNKEGGIGQSDDRSRTVQYSTRPARGATATP